MNGTSSRTPLRVIVRLGWRYRASREIARGVLRFAATHPGLHVEFSGVHEGAGRADAYHRWNPDGIIGNARAVAGAVSGTEFDSPPASPDGAIAAIRRACPSCRAVVFVHDRVPAARGRELSVATLACDHKAVAESAANLFFKRGLRNLAYVGSRVPERHYEERGAHFAAAARALGVEASLYEPASGGRDWKDEEMRLAAWLAALPKPCGVMAAFDARAKQVLDVCRDACLDVPGQIQVCGVDNEEWLCEQVKPSLTSVEPDFERGGYLAAEALAAMLHGGPGPEAPLRYGVRGVVERMSTLDAKGTARLVLLAREFIRMHASSGVSVADVVKAAGCSPRLLQRAFKTVLGTTPGRVLQDARLDRARDLLERTTTPISDVAALCGLESGGHLKVLFRRRFGASMSQWRALHGAAANGSRAGKTG